MRDLDGSWGPQGFPFLAACLVLSAACSPAPPPTTSAGQGPRRIVALTVGAVDSLAQLGELERVVAVEEDCFVPGTEHMVKIRNDDHSGPSKALNVEAVLALNPDLVIAKEDLKPALDNRGVRVQWVPNSNGLATIGPFVAQLGEELGVPDKARQMMDRMSATTERIRTRVARQPRVTVYFEAGGLGRSAGHGTVIDDMIHLAGGQSIAGDLALANPVLTSEAIVAANPDVILLSPWSDPPDVVAQRPGWNHISAVRSGRVHQIPERDRKVQYPSPSCVDGCERMLVPWLHPNLPPLPSKAPGDAH